MRQSLGLCAAAALVLVAGCRQDMQNEPKMFPQRGTSFYVDGRSVRQQVVHTVARGQVNIGDFYHTGLQDGKEVDALPFPVNMAVLERGQEQFNTYCSPCHSRVGNGAGMIVQRGYLPASYAQPWKMPDTAVYPTPAGPDTPGMVPAENITTPVTSRHPVYELENGDSSAVANPETAPTVNKYGYGQPTAAVPAQTAGAKSGGPK